MIDAYLDDLDTLTHEASHAVVAVMLGAHVVRVIGHRHQARSDDEHGSVEWLQGDLTPHDEATILLAGRIGAEGIHVPGDTTDERQAREVCPLSIDKARARAWILLQRSDVRQAVRDVCDALAENGYVMNGFDVERIVRENAELRALDARRQ